MSIIHVTQIRTQVIKLFAGLIDLSDQSKASPEMQEAFLLTRGLAAYSIHFLSGCRPEDAAASVTGGGGDNGIDAVHFDETNKRLYIVQSKWIKDGTGEPENGDVKKFVAGIRDLFNGHFDRFNAKVQSKKTSVGKALEDPATRYEVVLAYTGLNKLSEPSKRDLDELRAEMNDTSDVLVTTVLSQSELHLSLTAGIAGEPIKLVIGLKSWGKKDAPHVAYYGQVSASQVVEWWKTYRDRLFARNLRGVLGETEINAEIKKTLESRAAEFWYFNNGITIVARNAIKPLAGGAGNDFSTFHCDDISVVNGAQTVGTIGKFGETNPALLADAYVPIRIIVRGDDNKFGEEVTRANNRQNRIENRDFVALDPEQTRIRTELLIDGVEYQLMRSESVTRGDKAFDLVESTTALACASGTIRLPVQLKREIGKLWDDTSKGPYKELFNGSTPGLHVWRCVQMQRRIDRTLEALLKTDWKYYNVIRHGNRVVAAMVFDALEKAKYKDPSYPFETAVSDDDLAVIVEKRVQLVGDALSRKYPNSIIPTLFKNVAKCEDIAKDVRAALSVSP